MGAVWVVREPVRPAFKQAIKEYAVPRRAKLIRTRTAAPGFETKKKRCDKDFEMTGDIGKRGWGSSANEPTSLND